MDHKYKVYSRERFLRVQKDLEADLYKLTKDVWSDPGKSLFDGWLDGGDLFVIFIEKGKIEAFTIISYVASDAASLVVTMVSKRAQGGGVATKLNLIAIGEFIKIKKIVFRDAYFVFRTMSPLVYRMAYKNFDVYPDYSDLSKQPSSKQLELFDHIARKVAKDKKRDKRGFVIYNANSAYPQLNYKAEDVPWSGVREIDSFMDNKIGLRGESGAALIIVGRLTNLKVLAIIVYYRLVIRWRVSFA